MVCDQVRDLTAAVDIPLPIAIHHQQTRMQHVHFFQPRSHIQDLINKALQPVVAASRHAPVRSDASPSQQ
jgi:hypothetical protein